MELTYHSTTHTAQKYFMETEANSMDFITMMRINMEGRNHDDILNMDQMPILYSYHSNKMLDITLLPKKQLWL
jgi:hypothetical protein